MERHTFMQVSLSWWTQSLFRGRLDTPGGASGPSLSWDAVAAPNLTSTSCRAACPTMLGSAADSHQPRNVLTPEILSISPALLVLSDALHHIFSPPPLQAFRFPLAHLKAKTQKGTYSKLCENLWPDSKKVIFSALKKCNRVIQDKLWMQTWRE